MGEHRRRGLALAESSSSDGHRLFGPGRHLCARRARSLARRAHPCRGGHHRCGEKEILDVIPAPSESLDSWRCLLVRLRARGMAVEDIKLSSPTAMRGSSRQSSGSCRACCGNAALCTRCAKLVGACPRALKGKAPKAASDIWKAPSKAEARKRAKAFCDEYRPTQPRLTQIIGEDFEATLSFFDFNVAQGQQGDWLCAHDRRHHWLSPVRTAAICRLRNRRYVRRCLPKTKSRRPRSVGQDVCSSELALLVGFVARVEMQDIIDGRYELVMTGLELLEEMAVLIPQRG